jgi:cobalt-zinc-cadmium efflux system membrane fusion protein
MSALTTSARFLVLGTAALFCAAAGPPMVTMSPEQRKTAGLSTAQAVERQITEPVRVSGTIGFAAGHVAILRPLAPGRLVGFLAAPGDHVQAGQPLATLDTPSLLTAQEDLRAARANMRSAAAAVAVARDAARRANILSQDGSLSRAEAEQRRLLLEQAQAAADAARERAATLQTEVARLHPAASVPGLAQLTSPIPGVVASIAATPGEMIDSASPALTVADLSVVLVVAQIPEAHADLVARGDHATLRLPSGDDRSWAGTVASLGASLDPQARTLPARILLSNPDGVLRDGMAVDVTITSDRGRTDVTVPSAAIQLLGDRHIAFVPAGDNSFERRDVTLGVQGPDWTEIRQGVRAGETVVTNGSFALKAVLQQDLLGGAG